MILRHLSLAETALNAELEVLLMRLQYFHDITDHRMEESNKMSFLVEQVHDAVHSESYRTALEALTLKLRNQASKHLAK